MKVTVNIDCSPEGRALFLGFRTLHLCKMQ